MVKTRLAFVGIELIGDAPYPKLDGTYNVHFEPSLTLTNPICHPKTNVESKNFEEEDWSTNWPLDISVTVYLTVT